MPRPNRRTRRGYPRMSTRRPRQANSCPCKPVEGKGPEQPRVVLRGPPFLSPPTRPLKAFMESGPICAMRPDIGGARPAPKPSTGRETLPCSRPPKGEARTGPRVVEDRKPPATIPTALPGKPCPAPTADPSPPPPPGWFATAGMHYTNKIPLPHSPRRHRGDDDDLEKRPASNPNGLQL